MLPETNHFGNESTPNVDHSDKAAPNSQHSDGAVPNEQRPSERPPNMEHAGALQHSGGSVPNEHHHAPGTVANDADSAGVPWEGRSFQANPNAGDDGSADPALDAALRGFRDGSASQVAIVDALRTARVLIPLVAEKGDEGIGPTGLPVDKTQELAIVTVAAPDGRTVLPVFSSVATMMAWDPKARPIPVAGARAALSAASDQTDLLVVDPGSDTEYVVRRPAVWAIAQDQAWTPSPQSPEVFSALQESVGTELAVIDLTVEAGDPQARLHGPELIVNLHLASGLDQAALDAILQRLATRWAASDAIAVLVDSLSVKLRQAQ